MMKTWILATAFAAAVRSAPPPLRPRPSSASPRRPSRPRTPAGKTVSLADYKGKHVVLEWVNPGCPYVQKHYNSGNMPATQKDATAKGVVWLSVSSTAKDASDYRPPADARLAG